ncbi:ribosome biogenesis GTP-binding protein YihA/YsxC [Limibacter armeniacum]|uniref:ribosome biogenesis GTP-binding protein YihA/YsxC n=1 Tax=Limibacter armeniacum TaxID=466084 RepID=UPI002FE55989
MEIKQAKFVMSNSDHKKCPNKSLPEYAFIGRSNVGKSSLINAMTNFSKLAKTSGTPGKTQLINHFLINEDWYLVDLPGYGYAKVSKTLRADFRKIIDGYLLNRENLLCTFVLIDIRHAPQKIDLEFMEWMGKKGLPFVIVFTKQDKLKPGAVTNAVDKYTAKLMETWAEMPPYFVTSSETKVGLDDILDFIEQINRDYLKSLSK